MALSRKLEKEFKKLQFAIEKFMQIHGNPHDTSRHNEVADKLKEFNVVLSKVRGDDPTSTSLTEHEEAPTTSNPETPPTSLAENREAPTTSNSETPPTSLAENKEVPTTNDVEMASTNPTENTAPTTSGRRSISASVGQGGTNKEEDVLTIQELLNKQSYNLEADGKIGNKTIRAIKMFQGRLGMRPDGLVSPDKNTMKGLLGEIPAGPPSTGISAIIQGGESGAAGYNAYNRGTQGNTILGPNGPRSLITMTLGQIMADQKRPKSDPQTLFAVGKYQMIPVTLAEGVAALNLDASTKFDSTTQEYLFSDYLLGKKRPDIRAYIQGTGTAQAAQIAGAKEWASIADPRTGKSYYDGSGGNSAHITAEDFLATLDEAKVEYSKNIAAGMEPDAAYRKAVAGVGGEEDTNSDTGTNTDPSDTSSENPDTSNPTDSSDPSSDSTSQATINKPVGQGGANEAGDVSLVQELLNKKGESLKVDGKIGNNTINAIKRFQATLNMGTPDGLIEPGKNTIAALTGGTTGSSTDSNDPSSDPSSQATINKPVGQGGANEAGDVSLVQELLNKKGESLKVDGKIGNNTINAIKRFQATLNMGTPDGLIEPGKNTIAALMGGTIGSPTDSTTPTDSTSPSNPTDSNSPTEPSDTTDSEDVLVGTPSAAGTVIQESVGRKGINRPEDVRIIQEMLVKNNEKVGVDGEIGGETISAIISIQNRMGMNSPDGLVDPGKNTFNALLAGTVPPPFKPTGKYFSHPDAHNVRLVYGDNAVPLNNEAEHLLRSILAASGNRTGTVTSSLRTYYHQSRVMIRYYTVAQMEGLYRDGATLAAGRRAAGDDIQKFADFLEERDKARGAYISKHIPGHAIDVVPRQNRVAYAAKAKELAGQSGSGVTHFIELGQFGEKVDHIEFEIKVT